MKETSIRSSLRGTYFAISGLNVLNATPSNITKTINSLVNRQPVDVGGFRGVPGESPTLRETFDAISSLILANKDIYQFQKQLIIDYIASYRNPDGGYGLSTTSYTESTLRAIEIYNLLLVSYPNAQETILFLLGLQQNDGGFAKKKFTSVSYVVSTYRAIRGLELLNSQPNNVPSAINYLSTKQNADGGFGGFIGDTSDVTSTYRVIRALSILGDTTSINKNNAIKFLQDSQNLDGGFKRSTSDILRPKNISNMIYSYSSV